MPSREEMLNLIIKGIPRYFKVEGDTVRFCEKGEATTEVTRRVLASLANRVALTLPLSFFQDLERGDAVAEELSLILLFVIKCLSCSYLVIWDGKKARRVKNPDLAFAVWRAIEGEDAIALKSIFSNITLWALTGKEASAGRTPLSLNLTDWYGKSREEETE